MTAGIPDVKIPTRVRASPVVVYHDDQVKKMSMSIQDDVALVPTTAPTNRDVDTVPFVELFNNRLQGVVSASSDPDRIYCAFIEAGSGNYYSSTNNNRADSGTEKRLRWLMEEAVKQFGLERVARYLQVPGDPAALKTYIDIINQLVRRGRPKQEPAGTVFARFLSYLRHVELPAGTGPLPEMSWFVEC